MRFTIVLWGLSALWLAFPAISLPNPLAARTSQKRFAIENQDSEPAIARSQAQAPGDQVANGRGDENDVADPSDGLGTNPRLSSTTNLLQPNWWLQATRLYNERGSGRDYDNPTPFVIAEGQESQYPADWLQSSDVIAMLDGGRGSVRRRTMNLNTINSL